MNIEAQAITPNVLWIGRVISALAITFLLLDAAMKLVPLKPVIDAMQELGFAGSDSVARGLGVLLLGCTILYAIPSTAPLGALLLTGTWAGPSRCNCRPAIPCSVTSCSVATSVWRFGPACC